MSFLIAEKGNLLRRVFLVGEISKFLAVGLGFFPIPRVPHKCLRGYWSMILGDNPAGYYFVLRDLVPTSFFK